MPIHRHFSTDVFNQLAGHCRGVLAAGDIGQHHNELVTAQARHHIRITHRTADAFGDLAQQPIANLVAQ